MKGCTIAAVCAALFATNVHAEDSIRFEYFADAACTALKQKYEFPLTLCNCEQTEVDGETFDVCWQHTCAGAQATRNYYSDSGCTTQHPNVSALSMGSSDGTCGGAGTNRYSKMTCPVAITWGATYTGYASNDGTCMGDDVSSSGGAVRLDHCRADASYSDGAWGTDKSEKHVRSGNNVTFFQYTDLACSAGETALGTYECGVCTGGTMPQCPWMTPSATTMGAPPQALITAALAVPLVGLLASAVL